MKITQEDLQEKWPKCQTSEEKEDEADPELTEKEQIIIEKMTNAKSIGKRNIIIFSKS